MTMAYVYVCIIATFLLLLHKTNAQSTSVVVRIDTSANRKSVTVPASFLGLSHEPLRLAKNIVLSEGYSQMLANLARYNNGPFVIRWGGNSQDQETEVYDDSIWTALADLHKQIGVHYMLGLRLPGYNISYVQTQVSNALRILPPEAIVVFAVGNEPDNYPNYMSGFRLNYPSTTQFTADQALFLKALAPIVQPYFGTAKMFSAPGVARFDSCGAGNVQTWAKGSSTGAYAAMVTAHWYADRATRNTSTVRTFLDEAKMDDVASDVAAWASWSHAAGLPLRIEETNSLNIEGKFGASDTMGSALFALDYALTLVQAGADGMNFHNHDGCLAYGAIVFPNTCIPRVSKNRYNISHNCDSDCGEFQGQWTGARPLYYGMWMFAQAVEGRAQVMERRAVTSSDLSLAKVYGIKNATHSKAVIINKHESMAAQVTVTLSGYLGDATAIRLATSSPDGLIATGGVTVAGQSVEPSTGKLLGRRVTETLRAGAGYMGLTTDYVVTVPPASAVLLWATEAGVASPPEVPFPAVPPAYPAHPPAPVYPGQ